MWRAQNPCNGKPTMQEDRSQTPERFVDSVVASEFLSIAPRQLLVLARKGVLPAYPLGDGQRRVWRFRLSEIGKAMEQRVVGKHTSPASLSLKKALKGEYEESVWEHLAGDTSAPFEFGDQKQIAVKVIDDRGNELIVTKTVDEAQ